MRFRQQIGREGADDLALVLGDALHQVPACLLGNPVELAPQHGDAGFGVDTGGRDVLMPEELLHVGDVHADGQQSSGHGVAQEVRIDALGDAGAAGDLANDLADALAGECRRTSICAPLATDEQRPGPASADVQGHKTGQVGTHGHFAAFTALAVLDDNGALGQAHVFDAQRHEFRHARAGFQQHLHHQSDLAALGIGLVNEAQLFLKRQARRGTAVFLGSAAIRPWRAPP